MKRCLLLLVMAAMLLLVLPVAAVDINVTVATKGDTYIQWQWDAGYDLTHILIDGIEICGYETTNNSIIRSDLAPDSLHTINVSTSTDAGDATARTLPSSPSVSGIVDYTSDASAAAYGVVGGLLTSVLVVKRWKKDS
jgi:hypothetical protein